ncbi:unnamed protein product [Ranitomeya imitator]|uniref:Uncharacterized protein n=1 Tax=Ranitomeya imitator TaxID=111125 RepID=A0ABN9LGK1_9NEOB|nr:unnamed protein product [Ranitomeya imitator]
MLNRATNNRINLQPVQWNRHPDVASMGSSSRGGYSSNYNGSTTQSFANRLSHRLTPNFSERNSSTITCVPYNRECPLWSTLPSHFLRNWRIESYLNDHSDIPPESHEIELNRGDSNEGADNSMDYSLYSQSRLRTSILYKSTLPEQKEASSCTTNSSHSNSTIVDSQGSQTPTSSPMNVRASEPKEVNHFPSYDTAQSSHHHDVLKRHSLQVPDNSHVNHGISYNTNPGPSRYLYTTLATNRQPDSLRKPNDNILKRRSLPLFESRKVNLGHNNNVIPPNYIYTSLVKRQQENPAHPTDYHSTDTVGTNTSTERNHVDRDTTQPIRESLSTETLDEDDSKDSPGKKENKGSPSFLKKRI